MGNKSVFFSAVAIGSLAFTSFAGPANAVLDCDDAALWVNIAGEPGEMRKYSPQGALLDSFEVGSNYGDMALNVDATIAYGSDTDGITAYNTSTGAVIGSPQALDDPLDDEFLWALSGMPGGKLFASGDPDGSAIYEVDPSNGSILLKGDLDDADASLPLADQGGQWTASGDYVMAPDGDIVAFADNYDFEGNTFVVRINPDDLTDMTVVGKIPSAWGGARVGDNIYAALADGRIIRVNEFPTAASTGEIEFDLVVDTGLDEGVYGAAGTEDQYVGESGCTFGGLAETGTDASVFGFAGLALVAAGAASVAIRRRRA